MKWGDEDLVLTDRSWTIIAWVFVALFLLTIIWSALFTPPPCEGKTGQDYQNCIDLNYP